MADLTTITSGRDPDEYLFTAARGGPILDHNWRARAFNPARAGAEVPSTLTPHKLRHTAASMAIAAGADVKVVQQMLGHADASETLNTYAHLWPDKLDTIADALDAARSASLQRAEVARRDAISRD
ncbi:tyrosine-type recombinase/integrase [Demequina sp. NBRC 110057]|uniref:tyrosine-type recombinase/integrase n=1 Tax=Demequina sp. NBRC 110057 TaxID=1570346 RepID=UPI001F26F88E